MTEEPPFVAYDDCPRCGSNEVTVTEAGRLVCAGCGLPVASRDETMTEEPPFEAYDDCPRCGSNEVTVTEAGRLVCAGCGLPVEEM